MSWEESVLDDELLPKSKPKHRQKIEAPKENLLTPGQTVTKTWGVEKWIVNEESYNAKILVVNPGSYTSLHFHKEKKEYLYIMSGEFAIVTIDLLKNPGKKEETILSVGDMFIAEPLEVHQIRGIRAGQILETSNRMDKGDIYRMEKSR